MSPDILVKIISLFSFDLDFQRDIRVDTVVSISYELDEIVETGRLEYNDIKYASIIIDGKQLEYFKFITDDGYIDYFNREGKNVKKSILKTPLDGARISSNFGMRKHPISGFNKMHKVLILLRLLEHQFMLEGMELLNMLEEMEDMGNIFV